MNPAGPLGSPAEQPDRTGAVRSPARTTPRSAATRSRRPPRLGARRPHGRDRPAASRRRLRARAPPAKRGGLDTGSLEPGKKFGPYLLQKELGRGGMGVVFKALDTARNRDVALQLMLSQDVPEKATARFLREAASSRRRATRSRTRIAKASSTATRSRRT